MDCQILLNNHNEFYSPGDTIVGTVVCVLERPDIDIGIELVVEGTESTEWAENHQVSGTDERQGLILANIPYRGLKTVLSMHQDLTYNAVTFGRYPFNVTLPSDLPGSYCGKNGKIEFYIETILSVPNNRTYTTRKIINLVAPLDFVAILINGVRIFDEFCHYHDETEPKLSCCINGVFATMDVNLYKTIYTVGDRITAHVDIKNALGTKIHQINANLVMVLEEQVTVPKQKSRKFLQRLDYTTGRGVPPRNSMACDLDLRIPDTTLIYNFSRCSLFQQTFEINVRAHFVGTEVMEVNCQIFVGSKPKHSTNFDTRVDEAPPPSYDETMRAPEVYPPLTK